MSFLQIYFRNNLFQRKLQLQWHCAYAGVYRDTLQTSGGCDSIITLTLTVNPLPAPSITASGKILSTGTFDSYQWIKDNVEITGAISQSYTADEDGEYQVKVEQYNCSATSTVKSISTVTGILDAANNNGILIYPNPFSEQLTISATGTQEVSINTLEGKEILRAKVAGSLTVNELPQGVFIVKVYQEGELKSIQKVVKK